MRKKRKTKFASAPDDLAQMCALNELFVILNEPFDAQKLCLVCWNDKRDQFEQNSNKICQVMSVNTRFENQFFYYSHINENTFQQID